MGQPVRLNTELRGGGSELESDLIAALGALSEILQQKFLLRTPLASPPASCCFQSSLPAPPLLPLPFLWMLWLCQGANSWKQLSLLLRQLKPKSKVISSFFSGWLLESIFGSFSDPCLLGVDRKVTIFSPKIIQKPASLNSFPCKPLTSPVTPTLSR